MNDIAEWYKIDFHVTGSDDVVVGYTLNPGTQDEVVAQVAASIGTGNTVWAQAYMDGGEAGYVILRTATIVYAEVYQVEDDSNE